MSIAGLLSLLFALIAALFLVLYALQRRDLRKLADLSQQLQRIAIGGRLAGRVELASDKPELAALRTRPSCSPSLATAFTKRCWCTAM